MRPMSAGLTNVADRRRRFLFVDFLVRMWLLLALILLILPVPVRRKRLAAPRLVFIFGTSVTSWSFRSDPHTHHDLSGPRTIDIIRPSKLG